MNSEFIWHGRRYWVQEPTGNQHQGWNTDFEGCPVFKKTAKRIGIISPSLGILWLNREVLERDGKVYHSKPHEYFYAKRPAVDPEKPKFKPPPIRFIVDSEALAVLGLSQGCSQAEIKRAYKRLARKAHPDSGGSHQAFIELNRAYEAAMNANVK